MKKALYGFIVMLLLVISTQGQVSAEVSPSGGGKYEPGQLSHTPS